MRISLGNTKKKLLYVLGIYVLVTGVTLVLYASGSLDSWQERLIDRFHTRYEPAQPVIIIAVDDESLNEIGQWPWPREIFARALANIPSAAAIGIDINFSEPSRAGTSDDRLLADAFRDSEIPIVLPLQLAARGKVAAAPLPEFAAHTQEGFVNLPLDPDGAVRRAAVAQDGYPSFSALLSNALSPQSASSAPDEFRIRYAGPQRTFLTIPFVDLLKGTIPPETFEGSVVLVGVTANDLHDVVETPFGAMPGVEAHANALETMVGGEFLRPMPPWAAVPLLLLINFLVFLFILRIRSTPLLIVLAASLWAGFNLFGLALFSYGIIYPALYLNLGFLGSVVLLTAFQYQSESREKRFIRKTFQYYLMPEVVNELIEHPEKIALGGERRNMTVLFSDLKDFTAISERLSPPDLTRLMNEYLTAMTDVIMEHRGMVDKYIGDAVMAFWGAPLENPEQADDACRAALGMSRRLKELNAAWREAGSPEFGMRIGIATGPVVAGNMGSRKRFNYTVMGDTVNLASRLESLNKAYGTECLVNEATKDAAASCAYLFRELDLVRVKGKQEPKKIYRLVTDESTSTEQESLFSLGREAYAKGGWKAAGEHFTQALELGEHGPSRELFRRVREFMKRPPENWDGAYRFEGK